MTPAAPRIVSLLASGTEIVDALGLGECLVGISHECDHPPHLLDRPRVSRPRFDPEGLSSGEIDAAVRRAMTEHGSVYEIDEAVLETLDPDIIITQAVCEVCAVPTGGVREVLGTRGIEAEVVSLDAHTIDDILASLTQVARAAGSPEIARDAGGALRRRLDAVRAAVRDADPAAGARHRVVRSAVRARPLGAGDDRTRRRPEPPGRDGAALPLGRVG